jgi:hypothetical protein
MEVTGVRVCKVSAKLGVRDLAILYSSVTSLRGQRLCPGKRKPGYGVPYFYNNLPYVIGGEIFG